MMPMNIPSERTQQGNPESATDYCHQLKNGPIKLSGLYTY
ncbi:hypothetical protein LTSEUGA_5182 [Salmonella enterica subsp. enterica serovar Uganda str. R8-3404]|uniref:Uncharacterized protein n=1 Tax=Salmonella enterica subsp. enterica serovar Uganda str. R8-3404 TaxID=913083 RepID=A0A6C8GWL7_SALET|nr:hypothetical protein LTSEUGA_5182 [Salmonella enterica subsp. enterica serovar Uganda str. R8-3404]